MPLPDFSSFSDELKPTPIEDPVARRIYERAKDGAPNPWGQPSYEHELELRRLWDAKMAHDRAMRRTLIVLEGQEDSRRFVTWLAWWGVGTTAVILLMIVTFCTTQHGGVVLDEPDHYSRRP